MKKVVSKLRQGVKVKVDIVTSDIKIYYTGKFKDFTARYIIKIIKNIVRNGEENVSNKYFLLFPQPLSTFSNLFVVCTNFKIENPHPDSSMVSVCDSWPGGCEFDTRLRQTVFPAYLRLSPLLKHVRKVVGGFGKKVLLVPV